MDGPTRLDTSATDTVTLEEVRLASRNHGMPLEALAYPVTPIGLHYLLIHFDIPRVNVDAWRLVINGAVRRPLQLTLDELKARPAVTQAVTLECAGNGRARLLPRPVSQPWLEEAVGTAEWTGTPVWPLLEEAEPLAGAREVLFTGLDRGIEGGVEQDYAWSHSPSEVRRPGAILAWAINGQPLPPQHGFPLRLVLPGWYGMAQVKWLRSITLLDRPFLGWQQEVEYRVTASEDEQGEAVTRMLPRALMIPPGVPDFMRRVRVLAPGDHVLGGRAWSGWAEIVRVAVSADGGLTWRDAGLEADCGPLAWRRWSLPWRAEPGEHVLCCRAWDAAGNAQPLEPVWNLRGMTNNAVQRVRVTVGE